MSENVNKNLNSNNSYTLTADEVTVGSYVVINDRPCKVIEVNLL